MEIIIRTGGRKTVPDAVAPTLPPSPAQPPPEVAARAAASGAINAGPAPAGPPPAGKRHAAPAASAPSPQVGAGRPTEARSAGGAPASL
jgi:hypothetical protein